MVGQLVELVTVWGIKVRHFCIRYCGGGAYQRARAAQCWVRARSVDFETLHFDRKRCFLVKRCNPNNFFCSVMNFEALQEQESSAFRIEVFL